jgi:hypothetical protein
MVWARLLAHIAGTVNQKLLLKNEYLAAENRILRAQIKTRLVLSNAEKATLGEIGRRLGRKALEEIAVAAKPDTILGWFRKPCPEVRWIEIPSSLRPTQHRCGKGRIGGADGKREPDLGLRSHRGRLGQLGSQALRPGGREHPSSLRHPSRPNTKAQDPLERLHSSSPGGSGRDRLLYGGSPHNQRLDDLLCALFHSSGEVDGFAWRALRLIRMKTG